MNRHLWYHDFTLQCPTPTRNVVFYLSTHENVYLLSDSYKWLRPTAVMQSRLFFNQTFIQQNRSFSLFYRMVGVYITLTILQKRQNTFGYTYYNGFIRNSKFDNIKSFMEKNLPGALCFVFAVVPRDCADIQNTVANISGVYTVYIGSNYRPVSVYCDMTTTSGGWTVSV